MIQMAFVPVPFIYTVIHYHASISFYGHLSASSMIFLLKLKRNISQPGSLLELMQAARTCETVSTAKERTSDVDAIKEQVAAGHCSYRK